MSHTTQPVDILVIGGGIHGAGIAQAAAAAGYSVTLIEKDQLAAGTSSKSSKLIHGGLRYLESGQFSLVRESLKERELLLKLAPDLVKRQDFYIPLTAQSRLNSWKLSAGLTLYSLLSGFQQVTRFSRITPEYWDKFNPLDKSHLRKIFRYCDAQTDDALLTRAVADSAQRLGANIICDCEFISATRESSFYKVKVKSNNDRSTLNCRYLINAAGPWINNLVEHISPTPPSLDVELVQGTHLVFKQRLSRYCFYLEAPQDGRAVFALPWYSGTLVGTTETLFTKHPDQTQPLQQEEEYLLAVIQHYFPTWQHQPERQFSGLRVLPKSSGKPFHRSREVQYAIGNHYLALYGGKLTGYRATAEKVMQKVSKTLGKKTPIAQTCELKLYPPDDQQHPNWP